MANFASQWTSKSDKKKEGTTSKKKFKTTKLKQTIAQSVQDILRSVQWTKHITIRRGERENLLSWWEANVEQTIF